MNDINLMELVKKGKEQKEVSEQPISIDLKLTILEDYQILGDNALKIFEKYGTKASISDFTILLGGMFDQWNNSEDNTGYYWTRTAHEHDNVVYINEYGWSCYECTTCCIGCRPVLPYSSISNIPSSNVRELNGLLEVEYGEYPQRAVEENLQYILEEKYFRDKLNKTGKTYTTFTRKWYESDQGFILQNHIEYKYNDKKYVRFEIHPYFKDYTFKLSNGQEYTKQDEVFFMCENHVWIEVSPIKWLVDEGADIAITKDVMFAGVPFNKERNYKGDFENTNLYWFLNEIFLKDILSTNIISFNNNFKTKKGVILEGLKKDVEEAKKRMNEILEETNINTDGKVMTKKL